MKKKAIVTLLVVLILCTALGVSAIATNGSKTAQLLYDDIKITLNGQRLIPKDASGAAVEPFIIDGTTYLPVRAISEALGLEVGWDGDTSTVILTEPSSAPAPTPAPTPASASEPTMGQRNALKKADSYLSFMAFSHKGLVEQLEYEGFSHADAVYAADNCGANWNEQAAKKAASYLSFMSFSRSGLIEQLEYEGFTYEQAVYGVGKCGY